MDIHVIYDKHSYYIRYAISDNALHTCLHIYFDTRFICSLILTHIYTYIYTYIFTYIYTYIHTYIYLHTYILTYIHIQCISSPRSFCQTNNFVCWSRGLPLAFQADVGVGDGRSPFSVLCSTTATRGCKRHICTCTYCAQANYTY